MQQSMAPRFSREQRLLALILAVLAVAGGSFLTYRIISSSDSTSADDAPVAQHVVSITASSVIVRRFDASGSATTVASTTTIPGDFDALVVPEQGRWLLEDNRDTVVNYFDLAAAQPEMRSVELPFAGWAIEPRTVRPGNDSVLLYSPDGSLGLAIVNLLDGTAYPLASARAKYFEAGWVRDFMLFKEVDGLNTIIVPADNPTTFWTLKGAVVDIRGTTTLVATADGFSNFVTVFEGMKPLGVRVQVENPIMGGMLTEAGAVVLERTGGITILDNLTAKVKRAGVSDFGAQGAIAVADDRLYGWGGDGSALLDAEGLPVAEYLLGTPAEGEPRPLVATAGGTGCLVLQPGPQLVASEANAMLIAVDDGEQLVQLDATPSWVSRDGCTLVALDGTVVVEGREVKVDLDQAFSVAPDHRSVLGRVTGDDGLATFVLLDLSTKDTVELEAGFHLYATF